jgi:hypothetical protein
MAINSSLSAPTLLGQPGKRLLAWRNRVLASFKDALDYLKANPDADPQAITAVRNGERIKYGAGINIEQAINDEPGFLPTRHEGGWPDRDLRLHRDRRLHRGSFALKGAAWGRGMDTVGVGFAHNTLSSDRRKYLEAGGISFFIGDGALNFKPEQLFETYYSLHVWRNTFLTADYQRMKNPPTTPTAVRLTSSPCDSTLSSEHHDPASDREHQSGLAG